MIIVNKHSGFTRCGVRRVYGGGGGATSMPEIPAELKPLANLYTKQAEQLAQTPWQSYGGQRFADTNQTQNLGIGMVQNRALNGDPTINSGSNYLQRTLNTGPTAATANPYAQQGNPYLDSLVNKAQQSVVQNYNTMVKPQMESSMVKSGSFGNAGLQQMQGLQQQAAADKMGDIASTMYGNAWNQQANLAESGAQRNDSMFQNWRANNMNAAQLGLQYGNQAYQDAGQLLNAGNFQQGQQQRNLDFGFQQFQDAQNDPYKKMQATGGVVGQSTGQRSTSEGK